MKYMNNNNNVNDEKSSKIDLNMIKNILIEYFDVNLT
jgi:hypothetical protein